MNTLTLWNNPFADFDALVRRTFAPVPAARSQRPVAGFTPALEVVRDGDDALLRFELPGVDAGKDVQIEVAAGRLSVTGERRNEHTSEDGAVRFREVRYGSFRRSVSLPSNVSADDVSASYDAGVLTVRVAGAYAGSTVRRIPVTGTVPVPPAEDGARKVEPADSAPVEAEQEATGQEATGQEATGQEATGQEATEQGATEQAA